MKNTKPHKHIHIHIYEYQTEQDIKGKRYCNNNGQHTIEMCCECETIVCIHHSVEMFVIFTLAIPKCRQTVENIEMNGWKTAAACPL